MLRYFLSGLLVASYTSAWAMDADKLFAMLSPSVWVVKTYDADGLQLGQGSAVVTGVGRLLTNCHVLRKARHFEVIHTQRRFNARLEYIDVKRDMCQIVAEGDFIAPAVQVADSDALVVGSRVYAIGAPRGLDLTLSSGLITALRRDQKGALLPALRDDPKGILIQTDAAISPGSSGGGLFDDQGKLIGITSAFVNGGQNLNLAIPVNWAQELPARSKEQVDTYRAANSVTPTPEPADPTKVKTHNYKIPAATAFALLEQQEKLPASEKFRKAYATWLEKPGPRAFAISEDGLHYGSSSNDGEAQAKSLRLCERNTKGGRCWLYAVDERVVWSEDALRRIGRSQLEPR